MLPIFRHEINQYAVYYLPIAQNAEKKDLARICDHMKKGIQRIACLYEEESEDAYLVYDESLLKCSKCEKWLGQWQEMWDKPLYKEYREAHNLSLLRSRIPGRDRAEHLIILGEGPGMEEWLGSMVRSVKRLSFFQPDVPKGFDMIRSRMQLEYGILAEWKNSPHPRAAEKALVLDYSEKEKVFIWGIPRGSIWVDMNSSERRRHDLTDRDTGIDYISLKSIWREEIILTLDTVSKIQYNTEVKLDGIVGRQ